MSAHPIVVIGAGLAGAAAAWRLAQQGRDVLIVERSTPANPWGSSHGSARIFRYAYPDPFYANLVAEARGGWDELEDAAGETLITPTGSVDAGAARDPLRLANVMAASGVVHELLDEDAAAERWPGMAFGGPVLWHEAAGVIDAERAVEAMVRCARAAGAEVRHRWAVATVTAVADGYVVESEDGEVVRASQVVVASGAWLPDLLDQLGLAADVRARFPALEVRQEQALHFPYRDATEPWPTFIHKSDEIFVYGLPGGRDAGFRGQKVAEYNGGRVIRSGRQHDRLVDPGRRDRVVDYVARHLPGLVPEPYAETTCLFTNTPDEEFVIDRVDGLTILSPCSGHGAKFAPLIGEFAARLVGGGDVPTRFRPLRALAST